LSEINAPESLSAIEAINSGSGTKPTQLCNRGLKQDEVSARLARVETDDRPTMCGECETFGLAIQIA
jgi:hypothetical protein